MYLLFRYFVFFLFLNLKYKLSTYFFFFNFQKHDGKCTICEEECPKVKEPICASDGKTYESECKMHKRNCNSNTARISKVSDGECERQGGIYIHTLCNSNTILLHELMISAFLLKSSYFASIFLLLSQKTVEIFVHYCSSQFVEPMETLMEMHAN